MEKGGYLSKNSILDASLLTSLHMLPIQRGFKALLAILLQVSVAFVDQPVTPSFYRSISTFSIHFLQSILLCSRTVSP